MNNMEIKIPVVQRARGFRLYLANSSRGNQRLVDLWLNGGAAVLGHTPPNMLRELKNTASRGLYAPYPHFTEGRFLKALSKIFHEPNGHELSTQQRSFRIYAAPPPELVSFFESGKAKLWRPFVDPASPFAADDTPLLVPVLPGIQTWRDGLPLGLCVAACASEDLLTSLPASDSLSPILLAVATRGIYDILAEPQRAKPTLPRVTKVLKNSRWQRRGIYLTLKEAPTQEKWTTLFNQFLEAGFLLPPTPSQPLILPGELSNGEEAKLAAMLGR